jgi:hypothetical protein
MPSRLLRAARAAVAAVALLSLGLAASAGAAPAAGRRAILAFLPVDESPPKDPTLPRQTILDQLDAREELSLGLTGATQGRYQQEQALLDISSGTRTSAAAYDHRDPTPLTLFDDGRGGRLLLGWPDVVKRADSAPADIVPGLLGSLVPGGAGYAGVTGRRQIEAVAAADRAGRVRTVSLAPARNVARRAQRLLGDHRLVVVGLATGESGGRQLDGLIAHRAPGELLIVMQTPPDFRAPQLLPTGVLGLGPPHALTSTTTHQRGLIAGIDIAPTILSWLGVKVPDVVKGQRIRLEGKRDADGLKSFAARLRVISARRFPALETILAVWLAVLLAGGVFFDRRGVRWAMRVGGLAFCWLLPMLLVTAAIAPRRTSELTIIALGTFALGILTDLLVRWPRAIFVPCAVTVLSYTVDLARGSDLIVRSLLGPNPRFGSRYYGLGNELEATLPILLFIALAVVLQGRGRSRNSALVFGGASLVFGAVMGSGRLGADVGGVLTIGAGAAVAVLCLLPGGITRRAVVLAILTPALALVALAGLDLATGGNGHFTRTVLHADGEGALWDIISRRYELAFNVLKRGLMPFATGVSALAVAYGIRYRERIYAPLEGDPAWLAALWGSFAAALAGTLFNDSGPMLLLFGAFVVTVVSGYIRGDVRLARAGEDVRGVTRTGAVGTGR